MRLTDTPVLTVVAQAATAHGHLDVVSRERITGWAVDADAAGTTVALQILDNGQPIANVLANTYRADLVAAGFGDGRHGFDVTIPGGLSPLFRHVIQVRREADGTELTGSPRVIEAAGSFDESLEKAVAQAVEAVGDDAERERVLAFLTVQADALLQQRADAEGQRGSRQAHQKLVRRWGPQAAGLGGPGQRALVIDECVPVEGRDAGSQAVLSHIRALQTLGYSISLAAAEELAVAMPSLADQGIALCRAPFYASVEEVLRRQVDCFDIVYLHRASIASRYLNLARQYQPHARILYSVADLHHVRLERQAAIEDRPELLPASRAMRLIECTAAWSADAVLTHSAVEAALLRHMVPGAQVHHAPWSIATRAGRRPFAKRQGVAFIGHYRHAPNLDAARWLLEAVMPRVWETDPTIACLLVGSDLPDSLRRMAGGQVKALGHVADLGADVLDRVRLTIAPLRFGAGVKGKVLESFAAGVPCVMSPVAAEGLSLPSDLMTLVCQDEAGLAGLICRLHGNARAHGQVAKAGMAFMRAECSEAVVVQALQGAIEGRQAPVRIAS